MITRSTAFGRKDLYQTKCYGYTIYSVDKTTLEGWYNRLNLFYKKTGRMPNPWYAIKKLLIPFI